MKTFINFLEIVIGSILIWFIIVLATQGNIFKKDADDNGDNNGDDIIITPDTEFIDGTYQGTARGFKSDITVEITILNNEITSVTILEHDESEDISDPAIYQIPDLIVEANSTEVDDVAGATRTSQGIKNAVYNALIKAVNKYNDGTYQGTARGFKSDITVEIVIANGKITSVTVLEHNESEDISDPAIAQMPGLIVDANSTEVDDVAGASKTSQGIKEAVKDALAKALK